MSKIDYDKCFEFTNKLIEKSLKRLNDNGILILFSPDRYEPYYAKIIELYKKKFKYIEFYNVFNTTFFLIFYNYNPNFIVKYKTNIYEEYLNELEQNYKESLKILIF